MDDALWITYVKKPTLISWHSETVPKKMKIEYKKGIKMQKRKPIHCKKQSKGSG